MYLKHHSIRHVVLGHHIIVSSQVNTGAGSLHHKYSLGIIATRLTYCINESLLIAYQCGNVALLVVAIVTSSIRFVHASKEQSVIVVTKAVGNLLPQHPHDKTILAD